MDTFYGLLAVYFGANVVLCIGALYVGIVVEKHQVSGLQLAVMMALLLSIGWLVAVYSHNYKGGE